MMSLRARLIGLLVAAIVAVVILATGVTFLAVDGPEDGTLSRSTVQAASAVARFIDGSPERALAAGIAVSPPPVAVDAQATREIASELRKLGSSLPVLVEVTGERTRRLAFRVTDTQWARLALPSQPPSPLRPLVAYLSLVILGATLIAVPIAARILRPVRLMEGIIASLRADGTLTPLAESGTPEERSIVRSFNTLSARLAAAYESRMRFIAAAGHDLRTPMTRLRLRAEFLPDAERPVWLLDLAEMDAIADSAIRLVREETDPTSFEPVALAELAASIVDELNEVGLEASIATGPDAVVQAQPLALKRALRNLVENAARHGGGARVSWHDLDGQVCIAIEDHGPGIPSHLMDRVFEPFFSVDRARQKTTGGAGLGLAIAKEIVERQGGRIDLRNRPGGGLRQEIRLPAA